MHRCFALFVLVWPAACGMSVQTPSQRVADVQPEEIAWQIFLIGDAGKPLQPDPVLVELRRQAAITPEVSTVVFLGDNIYDYGLAPEGHPARAIGEVRLRAQLDAVRELGERRLFLGGNHDWGNGKLGGWSALLRQEVLIRAQGAVMLPGGGCPGPVARDFGDAIRLVILDTEWWLHEHEKPRSQCNPGSEEAVVDSLERLLADPGGRSVIVAGHHPLVTGGEHGGYFPWTYHVFPLRAVHVRLWLPLPVLGSAYPFARRNGITNQDFSGALNVRLRSAITKAFEANPPLIYAAGHEHNLQVFKGPPARYHLVSGGGSSNHAGAVRWLPNTEFARAASGFMRVTVLRNGAIRLGVVVVPLNGVATEPYSTWLKEPIGQSAPAATQPDRSVVQP